MRNVSDNLRVRCIVERVSSESCCAHGAVKNMKRDANSKGRTKNGTFNRWNMKKKEARSKLRRITVVFGRERFPAHVRRTPSTAKKIELQAIRCMEKTTRFVSQSTQKSIYEARECASTSKQLALFFLFCFSRHCMCKRFFSPAIFFAILVCRFTLKYSFFYDALSCNGNRLSFVWHFG